MQATVSIFLSYARRDVAEVTQIYHRLLAEGFAPWMDVQDILLGEDWERAIKQAIRRADFVLVCLSPNSADRRGLLQKEIKAALEIMEEKLEGDIYLLPVRLRDCEIPETLSKFQHGDLFRDDGWPRLLKAIRLGAERLELKQGIDDAVKEAEQFIDPRKRPEFEQRLLNLSPSMETLVHALYEIDNFIQPTKRLSFEHLVTRMLSRFIEQQIKGKQNVSLEDWTKHAPKWRELRVNIAALARRFELLRPSSPKDLQSTLMWIAERGTEGDLELLLQVEKDPPFHAKEIDQLIEFAKRRIMMRVDKVVLVPPTDMESDTN